MGVLEYFHYELIETISFYILCAIVLVDFIYTVVCTDKNKLVDH